MRSIIGVLRVLGLVFGFEVFLLLMFLTAPALLVEEEPDESAASVQPRMALVRHVSSVPIPSPTAPPAPYQTYSLITSQDDINARRDIHLTLINSDPDPGVTSSLSRDQYHH